MKYRCPFPVIILVGAARSGTTLLAEHILSHHEDVVYWSEPNHVWEYGSTYSKSDVRTTEDLTTEVSSYIRSQFCQYVSSNDGSVLLEKTPANCLRIPFIKNIFPAAFFIHLIRDGRDVAISARSEWEGGGNIQKNGITSLPGQVFDWARVLYRQLILRKFVSSIRWYQVPHYVRRAFGLLIAKTTNKNRLWGPRIPKLDQIRRTHSLLETCAIQWKECVDTVDETWNDLKEDRRILIRYEELLANPKLQIKNLIKSLPLSHDRSVYDRADIVNSSNTRRWISELSDAQQKTIIELIGPTLRRYGYI